MLRGLPASIVLHAVAIGAAVIGLPYAGGVLNTTESVIVPIELVDAGLLTDIAPVPEAEETAPEPEVETEEPDLEDYLEDVDTLPEPELAEAEDIADPEPSLDPVEAENRTEPIEPVVPTPEPETPIEEDVDPEPVEEDVVPDFDREEDEVEPVVEPEEPEPKQSAAPPPDPLKDLLNSSRQSLGPRSGSSRTSNDQTSSGSTRRLRDEAAAPRRGAGERERAIASFSDIVRTQMEYCWRDVQDLPDKERLVVTLKVTLNADGRLARDPELISPPSIPVGDGVMREAIERAINATISCVPYKLPAEDYDLWRVLDFRVGPKSE